MEPEQEVVGRKGWRGAGGGDVMGWGGVGAAAATKRMKP